MLVSCTRRQSARAILICYQSERANMPDLHPDTNFNLNRTEKKAMKHMKKNLIFVFALAGMLAATWAAFYTFKLWPWSRDTLEWWYIPHFISVCAGYVVVMAGCSALIEINSNK